jgi:hypothetical protein
MNMSSDPDSQYPEHLPSGTDDGQALQPALKQGPGIVAAQANPSITDPYADVLDVLSPQARRGLVAQLAVGFYDGWRPGRAEVADLVAVKLGILSVDECERRKQLRDGGYRISDIDLTNASRRRISPPPHEGRS